MDFKVIKEGSTLIVILGQKLSVTNGPALTDELSRYSGQGIERVVFDATGLMYLSSGGLRSVFFAYQGLGSTPVVVFVNCAKEIRQVLDHVGLTAFIQFEESPERSKEYRKGHLNDLSSDELEQFIEARRKELEQFAANNDVVCYNMRMGQED